MSLCQTCPFNLDEQNEIFREERFDAAGFIELSGALTNVNSSVVSYRSLRYSAWQNFLVGLARDETTAHEPPDAVVFIGTATHFVENPTQKAERVDRKVPFFYFEYFAILGVFPTGNYCRGDCRNIPDDDGASHAPEFVSAFPDVIDHLTRELHGTVFHITSANDLASAIEKMVMQLRSR